MEPFIENWPAFTSGGVVVIMIIDRIAKAFKQTRFEREIHEQWEIHLGRRAFDVNNEPKWYEDTKLNREKHTEVVTHLKELVTVNKETRDLIRKNGAR